MSISRHFKLIFAPVLFMAVALPAIAHADCLWGAGQSFPNGFTAVANGIEFVCHSGSGDTYWLPSGNAPAGTPDNVQASFYDGETNVWDFSVGAALDDFGEMFQMSDYGSGPEWNDAGSLDDWLNSGGDTGGGGGGRGPLDG